jgi:diphosphomevalonate decarboxylase
MKATAIANANVALIKYWGKRNEELILPFNSNIGITCDGLTTRTTVEFSTKYNSYKDHQIIINDEEFNRDEKNVQGQLDRIAGIAGVELKAKVVSETNFPVAAGLASSTSGFAALTLAACEALGLKYSPRDLSILVRQGSGSATRSVMGGFVLWNKGIKPDGTDSFAEELFDKHYWPEFRIIATILNTKKKSIASRAGMSQTVQTCPYFNSWVTSTEIDLLNMRKAINNKNFKLLGETAEFNALKMHATMIASKPAIIYWNSSTINIINMVYKMRAAGIEIYFTIDAGPNVKILCLKKDEIQITKVLKSLKEVIGTISCSLGDGVRLTSEHLF